MALILCPENMTGPGSLYSPAPSLNTTGYKTVIDTGTSFLVGFKLIAIGNSRQKKVNLILFG